MAIGAARPASCALNTCVRLRSLWLAMSSCFCCCPLFLLLSWHSSAVAAGDDTLLVGADSVQTINQLLTEMDGFENNKGVVFIAATNRPGVLDDAVVRPGRFDRIIHLSHPNLDVRMHCEKLCMPHTRPGGSLMGKAVGVWHSAFRRVI